MGKDNQGDTLIDKVSEHKSKYADELLHLAQLDNAGSKLLVVQTVILVALGVAMLLKSESLFTPALPIEWIRLVALLLAVFSFVCGWGHTLLALKIELREFQNNQASSNVMSENPVGIKRNSTAEEIDAIAKLSEVISEKKRNLRLAYEELTMGAWFMGITVAVSIGMKLLG
ncbi:hypothetical protein [uncultured Photobacterium sp.]|uniref:hypothetical protein n=1 Tax=uncultured Photobacterium sp. TaxID=173973 RepID=UPI002609FE6B|nr:hypothetical protein [uncultured Photobacterium sp.]